MLARAAESNATGGRTGSEGLLEQLRLTVRRKVGVVLRLLRGEGLGDVDRELQLAPASLVQTPRSKWKIQILLIFLSKVSVTGGPHARPPGSEGLGAKRERP